MPSPFGGGVTGQAQQGQVAKSMPPRGDPYYWTHALPGATHNYAAHGPLANPHNPLGRRFGGAMGGPINKGGYLDPEGTGSAMGMKDVNYGAMGPQGIIPGSGLGVMKEYGGLGWGGGLAAGTPEQVSDYNWNNPTGQALMRAGLQGLFATKPDHLNMA